MPVEDGFSITGRGTVATGRVERGVAKVGEPAEIVGLIEKPVPTVITGLEMFHKQLDEAMAGDNVGALLRGTKRDEVERGQVLAAHKTITPHKKFKAEVYVLSKEEGGRHTPFFNNYRQQAHSGSVGIYNVSFVGDKFDYKHIEDLFAQGEQITDEAARKEIYTELYNEVMATYCVIPLVAPPACTAWNPDLNVVSVPTYYRVAQWSGNA